MSAAERSRWLEASTILDRDAGAALEAAALKHEAAGTGSHAGDKPVYPLTAAFLRLVRSLRHNFGTLRYLGARVNNRVAIEITYPDVVVSFDETTFMKTTVLGTIVLRQVVSRYKQKAPPSIIADHERLMCRFFHVSPQGFPHSSTRLSTPLISVGKRNLCISYDT